MSFPDGIFEDFFRMYQNRMDMERKRKPPESRVRQASIRRNPDGSVILDEEKREDEELEPSE